MDGLLGYVAPIIAFLSAIIGFSGPSRKPKASGLAGLTPFGWSMLALASISFVFAIYGVYEREMALRQARDDLNRIRSVAFSDLQAGADQLTRVLQFAVLSPFLTSRSPSGSVIPDAFLSAGFVSIDLASDETIAELEGLVLDPGIRLAGPYAEPIPFGTDDRPAMTILAEESARAKAEIDVAIQKYASKAITADVFEAGSDLLRAPFLDHMITLRESWTQRARIEDSDAPEIVNLRMIGSGVSGGSKSDYLELIGRLDRLRTTLATPG
jgi:hypothetical protein